MGKQLSWRQFLGFLVACVMVFAIDHARELAESVSSAGFLYQRLVTSGFRPTLMRYSAIIEIDGDREPRDVTFLNVCEQRDFLSRVLHVVASGGPSAVVIDKFFGADSCRDNTAGTVALQSAIGQLLERRIPVVVGRRIDDVGAIERSLAFAPASNGRSVSEGALTLAQDERRLSLLWTELRDSSGQTREMNTLSLQGALARTPSLLTDNLRLGRFYARRVQPFAGFLPASTLAANTISPLTLLCGPSTDSNTNWRNCNTPDQALVDRLRGRVLLIGENTLGMDQHTTVVGVIPGSRLQATYLEALLNDDLYWPLPGWLTYIYGFSVFVLLRLVTRWSVNRKRMLQIVTVVGLYGLCYLLVRVAGVYLDPGVGAVGFLLGEVSDKLL